MVKHTLAWALITVSSLSAVYGMSYAATEADNNITLEAESPFVTPPPAKPKRTESGLDYFRFREGTLEWQTQHIIDNEEKSPQPLKCYGRTVFYDTASKKLIEEINDEFSGLLKMTPEDSEGFARGTSRISLRKEEMRYTLICGRFEKMIKLTPRDWPSNLYLKEFTASTLRDAKTRLSTQNKSTTTKPSVEEIVSITMTGSKKTQTLIPGSKNTVVAAFVLDVKKKVRINAITLTSKKWFVEPGVLKFTKMTLDGKDPDSYSALSSKKTLHSTGVESYGLFETVMPGKHLIELRASITNAPSKQLFSDAFTVSSIQGLTGAGLKLKLKAPVLLQTYQVAYDKNRTKQQDENLGE